MEETGSARHTGLTAAAIALVGGVIAAFVLLDLGPCADERLSAEEFVAQADDLCRQAHAEFSDKQSGQPPRTVSDAEELTDALVEIAEEERDAVRDLAAPEDLSDQVDRYLDARERGIDLLRDGREAAKDADSAAYGAAQAALASTQLDPRYALARDLGLRECSKPLVSRAALKRQSKPPATTELNAPPEVNNPPTEAP